MLTRICFIFVLMYSYRFSKGWRWIRPCGHNLFETSKYIIMPFTIQTIIESFWMSSPNYLPARFCMLLVGMGCLTLLYSIFHFLKCPHATTIILPITTVASFLFEKDYLSQPYLYQPHDNLFAALGILFIIFICILNTYYPPTT